MDLTCPKCSAPMRTYERNRVTIDQCTECRGVFLDRGELERLIDAEAEFAPTPEPRGAGWRPDDSDDPRYRDDPQYGDDRRYDGRHGRRRRGFLGDFFDFD